MYDRVASFLTYLFRTMQRPSEEGIGGAKAAENYVLVTHGLLMRIFCMCYLRWTVTEFEQACKGLTLTLIEFEQACKD